MALAMITFVLTFDQTLQIAVIIATANLHVQTFAAWMACNLVKPPNDWLYSLDLGNVIFQLAGGSPGLT
jgi:hypothetical protein